MGCGKISGVFHYYYIFVYKSGVNSFWVVINLICPNFSHLTLDDLLEELRDHLKNQNVLCRYCGSSNIVKKGFRKNNHEDVQRYNCHNCSRSFTDDVTRYGNQDALVHDKILDLAVLGVNPESIKEMVNKELQRGGKKASITKQTVLNIIKKDCQFLSTFEYYLCHNNFSSVWEMDETFEHLKRKQSCYVFNIKAIDTKYWLVSYASMKRNQMAQKIALTYAFDRAEYTPDTIITDGFAPKIDNRLPPFKNCKIESISKKIDYSCINNIERINLSQRDLIPKGSCVYSIEHLQSLVELKRIHYNFLQKHPSFANFTPAKIVGMDIPIKNWIDLFRIADFFDRKIGHHFT